MAEMGQMGFLGLLVRYISDAVGEQLKKGILKVLRSKLNLTCGGKNGLTCPWQNRKVLCYLLQRDLSVLFHVLLHLGTIYWVNTTISLLQLYCQMETNHWWINECSFY